MRLSHFSLWTSLFLLFLLVLAPLAHSASIKERMASRIPAINQLKDSGAIGEDNNGFLAFRGGNKSKAQLISDENKDRKSVYVAIGKKQGASPGLVGQRRAKMIAEKGKKGHWFQNPKGEWYKK